MTKLRRASITGSSTKSSSTYRNLDDIHAGFPLVLPSDHSDDEEENHIEDEDKCENSKPLSWRIKTRGSTSNSNPSPSLLTRSVSSRIITSTKSRRSQIMRMASLQKVTSSCSKSSTTAKTQSGAGKSSEKQSNVFKKASGFLVSRRSSLGKQRSDRTDASSELSHGGKGNGAAKSSKNPTNVFKKASGFLASRRSSLGKQRSDSIAFSTEPSPGGKWNEIEEDETGWEGFLDADSYSLSHLKNNEVQGTTADSSSSTCRTLVKSSPPSVRNKKSMRGRGQTRRLNHRLDRQRATSQKRTSGGGGGTSSNRHRSRSPRLLDHLEGRSLVRQRRPSVGGSSQNTTNASRRGLRRSISFRM